MLNDMPVLKVKDCTEALGQFAAHYRMQNNFKVVAITGSVGKTTTKHIASHVLSKNFSLFASPKSFNNNIGLPLTLLGAEPKHQIIIAELGSNHPGEIASLTRITQPDIAVVTNTQPSHLAGFENIENIVQEKLSIAEGLRNEESLIINGDCEPLSAACRNKNLPFTTFGLSQQCDIQAQAVSLGNNTIEFTLDGQKISLPLPGRGNIENALAAWAICSRFKISAHQFAAAVKTVPPLPMRCELMQIGPLKIINDCYNANPVSMKNALDILARQNTSENRRLVLICADMAELGTQATQLHQQLGRNIAKTKVKLLITIGTLAKIAAQTAKETADYDLQIKSFEQTPSACNYLEKIIKDSDIVLVKGSRRAKLEMVIEKLKELFQNK